MSGVYIEGMEMPTTCGSCWFCHAVSNEKRHCRLTGKSFASYSVGWENESNTGENVQHPYIRRDDCPLVHVQPHGRLGDLDKLNEEVSLLIKENMFSRDDARDLLETIADAPTVIPASGTEAE